MIGEIWEAIVDFFSYVFSFEWFGELYEGFLSLFENMGQISMYGIGFAIFGFAFMFITQKWMLDPFLSKMTTGTALFWLIATYAAVVIVAYFIGKHFENTA